MTLSYSYDYLTRQPQTKDWIKAYCKRNKITIATQDNPSGGSIVLGFNSVYQLKTFVRLGNREFPHFEFL